MISSHYDNWDPEWSRIPVYVEYLEPVVHAFKYKNYDDARVLLDGLSNIDRPVCNSASLFHYHIDSCKTGPLNLIDLRLTLLLLKRGANPDLCDKSGLSVRRKLLSLGYKIDRVYLVYTLQDEPCNPPKIRRITTGSDTTVIDIYDELYN